MSIKRVPKHRQVFDSLQREIAAGKYRDGRMPSEMQLVRRFGLSRPTVARALIDLQKIGLLDRRVGSGTYLRTTPPPSNKLLGLLVPGLANNDNFVYTKMRKLAPNADVELEYDPVEREAWLERVWAYRKRCRVRLIR